LKSNRLIRWGGAGRLKNRDLRNEGKSVEVIENKYRKNVWFLVCVEVDENKILLGILCGC
jgi:hypothetical protein